MYHATATRLSGIQGVHDRIKLFTDFLIQIVDMKIQQALVELDHVLA